jgi:hypothetical protein
MNGQNGFFTLLSQNGCLSKAQPLAVRNRSQCATAPNAKSSTPFVLDQ